MIPRAYPIKSPFGAPKLIPNDSNSLSPKIQITITNTPQKGCQKGGGLNWVTPILHYF